RRSSGAAPSRSSEREPELERPERAFAERLAGHAEEHEPAARLKLDVLADPQAHERPRLERDAALVMEAAVEVVDEAADPRAEAHERAHHVVPALRPPRDERLEEDRVEVQDRVAAALREARVEVHEAVGDPVR